MTNEREKRCRHCPRPLKWNKYLHAYEHRDEMWIPGAKPGDPGRDVFWPETPPLSVVDWNLDDLKNPSKG